MATTGEPRANEELMVEARRLSELLVRVAEQAKAEFAQSVAVSGLPLHLARAVMNLDVPAPMRELAERLACDRSYITGLADGLEERDLVCRVPGADRRTKLLELTEAGRRLRSELSGAVASNSAVLRRLTADEREALEPLLRKILGDEDGTGESPGGDCRCPAGPPQGAC